MPIIICPECGGKVSTTLTACPHCGFKIEGAIPEAPIANDTCILNIKREHRQIGKIMDWYIYEGDKEIKTLLNGEVFSITLKKPGEYKFIVYHANNAPTTKPLSRASIKPAIIELQVTPADREITAVVDLNSGMFSASLIVKSIERK